MKTVVTEQSFCIHRRQNDYEYPEIPALSVESPTYLDLLKPFSSKSFHKTKDTFTTSTMSTAISPDTNMLLLRNFMEFCLNQLFDNLAKMVEDPYCVDTTGTIKYIIDFLTNRPQIHYFRTESETTEKFYRYWLKLRDHSLSGALDTGLHWQGQKGLGQIMMIFDTMENAQMHEYEEANDSFTPGDRQRINNAMHRLGYLG